MSQFQSNNSNSKLINGNNNHTTKTRHIHVKKKNRKRGRKHPSKWQRMNRKRQWGSLNSYDSFSPKSNHVISWNIDQPPTKKQKYNNNSLSPLPALPPTYQSTYPNPYQSFTPSHMPYRSLTGQIPNRLIPRIINTNTNTNTKPIQSTNMSINMTNEKTGLIYRLQLRDEIREICDKLLNLCDNMRNQTVAEKLRMDLHLISNKNNERVMPTLAAFLENINELFEKANACKMKDELTKLEMKNESHRINDLAIKLSLNIDKELVNKCVHLAREYEMLFNNKNENSNNKKNEIETDKFLGEEDAFDEERVQEQKGKETKTEKNKKKKSKTKKKKKKKDSKDKNGNEIDKSKKKKTKKKKKHKKKKKKGDKDKKESK